MEQPLNIEELRKEKPVYAAKLDDFAAQEEALCGADRTALQDEAEALKQLEAEIADRRKKLREGYQALKIKKREGGFAKFPVYAGEDEKAQDAVPVEAVPPIVTP